MGHRGHCVLSDWRPVQCDRAVLCASECGFRLWDCVGDHPHCNKRELSTAAVGSGDLAVLSSWFANWRVSGAVVCCPFSKAVLRVLCSWDCGIPVHWESLTLWHRRETVGVPPLRGRFSLSDHSRVATGGKACEYRRCLNWLLVCCVLGSGNRFLVVRAGLWVC